MSYCRDTSTNDRACEPSGGSKQPRSEADGTPHPFGRPRGLDHPSGVGATPPGGQDLNERSLRAEFGPRQCPGPKGPRFKRPKEIAMSVPTISPRQLADLCESGKIDLIDVRTSVEFRELHAAHARNLPLDRVEPVALMQARNGSKEEPLYVICRSGSRGRQGCEKFLAAGFTNVVNVEGGTLAWAECGLPVVRGRKAISLERQVRIAAGSLVLLGVLIGWLVHPV